MTRDDIIRLAQEAWGDSDPSVDSSVWRDNMVRFAALIAAAERAACARVCEERIKYWQRDDNRRFEDEWCAAAIRARGAYA